jgi:hypothetical protein
MPDDLKTDEAADFDSELVPLVERAVRKDNTIDLKLIAPGWGSSGYYSADVLREDGPQAWPAGTHMYLDHPTESGAKERPERSVRDLAAVTVSTPEFREKGVAGPGLYAKASVLPQYSEVIDALAPYIGVSIRAGGSFREGEADGKTGRLITKIVKSDYGSVDFVTKPGAGGKVLALMESMRAHQNQATGVVSSNATTNNFVQTESSAVSVPYTITTTGNSSGTTYATPAFTFTPDPVVVVESESQEADDMELQEAQEQISALETQLKESTDKVIEESTRAERAEGALAILEAQGEARKLMENISLPAAAKTRIVTKVSADPRIGEDGKIDMDALKEAVEAESKVEAEYIESIVGAGKVTDQGSASGDAKDDSTVKESLKAGLGKFFGLSDEAAQRAVDGR